jgi:hypothetical protein
MKFEHGGTLHATPQVHSTRRDLVSLLSRGELRIAVSGSFALADAAAAHIAIRGPPDRGKTRPHSLTPGLAGWRAGEDAARGRIGVPLYSNSSVT